MARAWSFRNWKWTVEWAAKKKSNFQNSSANSNFPKSFPTSSTRANASMEKKFSIHETNEKTFTSSTITIESLFFLCDASYRCWLYQTQKTRHCRHETLCFLWLMSSFSIVQLLLSSDSFANPFSHFHLIVSLCLKIMAFTWGCGVDESRKVG